MEALQLTYEIGPTAAARQLGISKYTVYGWLNKHRRDMAAGLAIAKAYGLLAPQRVAEAQASEAQLRGGRVA